MTSKAAFTHEEGSRARAPMVAGMAITIADPGGPIEISKEMMATLRAATVPPSQGRVARSGGPRHPGHGPTEAEPRAELRRRVRQPPAPRSSTNCVPSTRSSPRRQRLKRPRRFAVGSSWQRRRLLRPRRKAGSWASARCESAKASKACWIASEALWDKGGPQSDDPCRAGDGNRTRTTSLEGWSSTIELHPRGASLATPGWDTSPVEVSFRLVDAFTETPFKGNRLCVVPEIPEGLSDDQMRMLALETNFSETTFVTESHAGGYRMRIFTPDAELPFAGHPPRSGRRSPWRARVGRPSERFRRPRSATCRSRSTSNAGSPG